MATDSEVGVSENRPYYNVQTQFFSMVLVKNVKFEDENRHFLFGTPQQQADLLNMTVKSSLCQRFPPSLAHQLSFLKAMLKKCEENGFDICDDLYESYASLIGMAQDNNHVCFKTYFLSPNMHITLEESTQMISHGTTGLCTWQAAKYLAEWAVENKAHLKNRHILELGSGLGFTGLVICKWCCPAKYTFTDCNDYVLHAIEKNVAMNLKSLKVETEEKACCHCIKIDHSSKNNSDMDKDSDKCFKICSSGQNPIEYSGNHLSDIEQDSGGCRGFSTYFKKLDWENFTKQEITGLKSEVILAADVVYDDRLLGPLGQVLSCLLSSSSSVSSPVAFISSTVRNEATFNRFIEVLDEKSISWNELEGPSRSIFHYDKEVCIKLMKLSCH
ncbi:protein-lysine N-methyltransferase EEF2KMT-like [Anneissia japonica]|uniref:protein-lysine N-methyltransferase EEF2KMT-like n=1 Tax=Anneissia japonica TaxID=1529436 RepID=UPI001425988F|nr:protein-lysine N-methyltransferase EEF2KMT-like [Anneissia japonica]